MLKVSDANLATQATGNLKVFEEEWVVKKCEESEEELARNRRYRSFKDCEKPAEMRAAAGYTD
eukprot:3531945-Alexandrium_andersonii.AAC.1